MKKGRSNRSKAMTAKWTRNVSDERAAAAGYWFDPKPAEFIAGWIQDNCRLYEGDDAGKPLMLLDWQHQFVMRMFGWVHLDEEVGRVVRRFRKAFVWVPKKNKKTSTEAAIGLALLCGDGEKGAKVFSAAKDGTQARLAQENAIQMVRQIPDWPEMFSINGTTGQICYLPTNSTYSILSVDGAGESKEGINGSVLIDEAHVVDRRFARIIARAGISRSEPMQISFSTAGNNPDGWGHEMFLFGAAVEKGEINAPHVLNMSYAAPQNTKADDLKDRANLIRLGKLANPAWGHTIRESEFVADYEESCRTVSGLTDFLMYRLNIWSSSFVSMWLNPSDWSNCAKEFSERDLQGHECFAGLDLASVDDLNSLCLCFPEPEGVFRFLWWHWLPLKTAQENEHRTQFLQWATDPRCNLTLTEGGAVHHEIIAQKFVELAKVFRVKVLAFDPRGAELTSRWMSEGLKDSSGKVIMPGSGVPRFEYPQQLPSFNEPTKKFESLVRSGTLLHNSNPVVDWQAGHAALRLDSSGNCKPVKPDGKHGIKKVDALISGVMALAQAMFAKPPRENYYNSHNLEVLSADPSDYGSDGNFKFDRRTNDERRLGIRENSWREI